MAHTKKWIRTEKRIAIYLRDGLACAYCGRASEDGYGLGLDHLIPRSKGGGNNSSNLITCCNLCNSIRGDMDLGAWLERIHGDGAGKTAAFITSHIALDIRSYRAEARTIIERRRVKTRTFTNPHTTTED